MALHERLWPDLVKAMRGLPVSPLKGVRGSINYRLMNWSTWYIIEPSEKDYRDRLLQALKDMGRIGHLSLEGPGGIGTEAGAPGMHWSFNFGAICGALEVAYGRLDVSMIEACLEYLRAEFGLNRHFRLDKKVCFPCPRVKDEKKQKPLDKYRDIATSLALGETVRKRPEYWEDEQSAAVASFRRIMLRRPELSEQLMAAPLPLLYIPIERRSLGDDGYLAWVERTPQAEKNFGRDGCNWTLCRPGAPYQFGFDWEQLPEVNEKTTKET